MNKYESPELELISFDSADILTTSPSTDSPWADIW